MCLTSLVDLILRSAEKILSTLRLTVECRGTAVHGSTPLPNSSVELLGTAIARLSKEFGVTSATTYSITNSTREFFQQVSLHTPSPVKELFQALGTSAAGLAALSQVPAQFISPSLVAQLRSMVCNTVTPTLIEGGVAPNVVPGVMKLIADVRLMPGTDVGLFLQGIKQLFPESAFTVALHGGGGGYEISLEDPVLKRLSDFLKDHWKGKLSSPVPVPMLLPASSDNASYFRAGFKPIGFAPLLFPPGFPGFGLTHGTNERIPRASFYDGFSAYLSAIDSSLGSR
jgi:acetylornithine deacetylase/succinyl-diaminopimelate desuccinylase-like protein